MKNHTVLTMVVWLAGGVAFAGNVPPVPPPTTDVDVPQTPEGIRTYKMHVLERRIAEDKNTIAHPDGSKERDRQEKVQVAKANLKVNEGLLADLKAGKEIHEVYFCSMCGREYMKTGTCPHCKVSLNPLFPGAKRTPAELQQRS